MRTKTVIMLGFLMFFVASCTNKTECQEVLVDCSLPGGCPPTYKNTKTQAFVGKSKCDVIIPAK